VSASIVALAAVTGGTSGAEIPPGQTADVPDCADTAGRAEIAKVIVTSRLSIVSACNCVVKKLLFAPLELINPAPEFGRGLANILPCSELPALRNCINSLSGAYVFIQVCHKMIQSSIFGYFVAPSLSRNSSKSPLRVAGRVRMSDLVYLDVSVSTASSTVT